MKINKESLIIENDRIRLRALRVEDITEDYINGLNDSEVNKYLVDVRRNLQTRGLVEEYVRFNFESTSSILFGIFIDHERRVMIGTLHVSGIDFFHFTASIGICLFAKQSWKKGYALQAMRLVKDYLFKVVGLHYIEAGIYAENKRSINLFSRAGFIERFRVKDKFRFVDSFEQVVYFAAINPHFDRLLLRDPPSGKSL